jgi:hypothetical protein
MEGALQYTVHENRILRIQHTIQRTLERGFVIGIRSLYSLRVPAAAFCKYGMVTYYRLRFIRSLL